MSTQGEHGQVGRHPLAAPAHAPASATSLGLRRLPHTQTVAAAIPSGHSPQAADDGDVTLIVAARNEREHLAASLPSFLVLENVSAVVIVDDHSQDRSLTWLTKESAVAPRLRLVKCPDIPCGWNAKSYALFVGAQVARTDFLLFTDADVSIAPSLVTHAVQVAATEGLDHLSGFFRIDCVSVAEKCCGPVLAAVAVATMRHSARKHGAGVGAFNLVRKATYHAIGGHASFRNAIVDDVYLARKVVSSGGKSAFLDLSSDVHVRLFEGVRGFFRAVERSTSGFLSDWAWLPQLVAGTLTFLSTFVWLLLLVVSVKSNLPSGAAACLLLYLSGWVLVLRVRRYCSAPWMYSMVYPLVLPVLGAAVASSAVRRVVGLPITWSGRSYSLER